MINYIIIGLLVLGIIINIILLFRKSNNDTIERLGKLETELTKELGFEKSALILVIVSAKPLEQTRYLTYLQRSFNSDVILPASIILIALGYLLSAAIDAAYS